MSLAPAAKPRRLFLALWPSEAERKRIAALAQTVRGGRVVKTANFHLTLVFLGAVDAERWFCYATHMEGIAVPPFSLVLDRLGYWTRSRILWLGASRTPAVLSALVADLQQRLIACGFTPEHRPFAAHVTLVRDFPGPAPAAALAEPISWVVDHVVLAESSNDAHGVHYAVLQSWPGG